MMHDIIPDNKIKNQGKAMSEKGVAIVTGGRRGIGRAICLALAARGFDIAILDIVEDASAEETLNMVRRSGRMALFVPYDISCVEARVELLNRVEAELGLVTCLVNNAGVQTAYRGDLLDVMECDFDRLMGINLRGTFFLTQEVARRMAKLKGCTTDVSIITITSANANLVSPEKGAYGISKAALSMAMQQFAVGLAHLGIRVHEIRPGLIQTDMTADVSERYTPSIERGDICPMRRWGVPEDVAEAVASLACGALPYSTGDIYNIGGGMQIPRL